MPDKSELVIRPPPFRCNFTLLRRNGPVNWGSALKVARSTFVAKNSCAKTNSVHSKLSSVYKCAFLEARKKEGQLRL